MSSAAQFVIETQVPKEELSEKLQAWAPWRHEIWFSNGVKTTDFATTTPFTNDPLNKFRVIEAQVPMESVRGGAALDIGFNAGYNSIQLAQKYGMKVTGIDVNPRHKEVAEFLGAQTKGAKLEFLLEDATTFSRPEGFDLVLHLGTLYHLPNPMLSLEHTAKNLKPGGYLALETTAYVGKDGSLCKFVRGFNGDMTNYWALSKPVLEEMLEMYGFTDIRLAIESRMKVLGKNMTRVLYVARKKV